MARRMPGPAWVAPLLMVVTAVPALAAAPAGEQTVTVAATADRDGYHLYSAGPDAGGRWRALATLQPGGDDRQPWIGEHCLSGDGRWVVAVVAPWQAGNSQAGIAHGGIAYAVDARSGAVRPLATGVALTYFSPGCGSGDRVALTSYLGRDQATTRVSLLDAGSGASLATSTLPGELTSAVPVGDAVVAAAGGRLLRLAGGAARTLGRVPGQAFQLHPNQAGGVDLLVAAGGRATVWRSDGRGLRQLGGGRLGTVTLLPGLAGRNQVAGAERLSGGAGLQALSGGRPAPPAPRVDVIPYEGARRGELRNRAGANGSRLWMSEFGFGGNPSGLDSAVAVSAQIAKDLQYLRPSAWVYWQAVEQPEPGAWGLLQQPFNDQTRQPDRTERFWAMAQYSRFIRPGYQVLTTHDPRHRRPAAHPDRRCLQPQRWQGRSGGHQ